MDIKNYENLAQNTFLLDPGVVVIVTGNKTGSFTFQATNTPSELIIALSVSEDFIKSYNEQEHIFMLSHLSFLLREEDVSVWEQFKSKFAEKGFEFHKTIQSPQCFSFEYF